MSFHLPGLACRRGSHCLQAQGCDTKKEQKFVHICSSAGPVQGEGKSLTVTFQGACQVAVLMPTALCRDLCLKQTCSDRGGTKSLKPIPGWCWQGGRSVQQPGFPEQPGGWHTGSSSQPKGRPWRLGPQPVWAARLCAGSRPSLLNPERPGGEKPTHKWEQLSEVGPG